MSILGKTIQWRDSESQQLRKGVVLDKVNVITVDEETKIHGRCTAYLVDPQSILTISTVFPSEILHIMKDEDSVKEIPISNIQVGIENDDEFHLEKAGFNTVSDALDYTINIDIKDLKKAEAETVPSYVIINRIGDKFQTLYIWDYQIRRWRPMLDRDSQEWKTYTAK